MEPRIIENHHFQDERGHFVKVFDGALMKDYEIVQSNCVTSKDEGTFRGLHMQQAPYSEVKFFLVVNGSIQLVCLNLDQENIPIYKTFTFRIDDATKAVLVPKGYATGYLTLVQNTTVLYFSDQPYKPKAETGIRWNDPILNIDWITDPLFISEKDRKWPTC